MDAIRGEVIGKVQGVFFRKGAKAEADSLGISGWVTNTKAGTVEFLIAGDGPALEAMLRWLLKGPRLARVDTVTADKVSIETCQVEGLTGFAIRY